MVCRDSLFGLFACNLVVAFSLFFGFHSNCHAEGSPPYIVGSDSIITYNSRGDITSRIANLSQITGCASVDQNSFLLINSKAASAIRVDRYGNSTNIVDLFGVGLRISQHKSGYLLVNHLGMIEDIGLDGKRVWASPWGGAVNAILHPHGEGFLVLRSQGDIAHMSLGGEVLAHYGSDTAGRALLLVDIALEGPSTLVALDAHSNELISLDTELKEIRRVMAPFDLKNVISTHSGAPRIVAIEKDKTSIHLFTSQGESKSFTAKSQISCAIGLDNGAFALGYSPQDGVYSPAGSDADLEGLRPTLAPDSLFAVIVYALVGSLIFAYLWNRIFVRRSSKSSDDNVVGKASQVAEPESSSGGKATILGRSLAVLFAVAGLIGCWLSYWPLRYESNAKAWLGYSLGGLAAALSICYLYAQRRKPYFLQALLPSSATLRGNRVSWFLLALSLSAVIATHFLIHDIPNRKWLVVFWIVGQVFAVTAFTSNFPRAVWNNKEGLSVFLLLVFVLVTRLFRWTDCPPEIHFDGGIVGDSAVRMLYDNWSGLFELKSGQTIGGAWLLQMAAGFWAFGVQETTLRLTSLVWMVGLVFACYLLGRELVSHRFGLIFGILVAAQHNLIAYSRLPYVIESAPPLVFSLYYLCRGVRRHALRDWCLVGIWAGWSMMTIRTFTKFPAIWGAIGVYCLLLHSRTVFRHGVHVLAMLLGAIVVFSPNYYFYTTGQHLTARLAESSPLLSGLKLNPDLKVWDQQMSRAFGAILQYPDVPPWFSESSDSICLAITGAFFCVGLILLLIKPKSLITPMFLFPMAVSIALGSGFIRQPPSYYHCLVGITFVMGIAAIPIECLFELSSWVKWRIGSYLASLTLLVIVGLSMVEQIEPFVSYCGWTTRGFFSPSPPKKLSSLFSEHLLQRKDRRFVHVTQPEGHHEFQRANSAIFYGQFSERHEVDSPIRAYLPMRPYKTEKQLEFMSVQHPEYLEPVKQVYPGGVEERFLSQHGELFTYTVSAEQVASTYQRSFEKPELIDQVSYALVPR